MVPALRKAFNSQFTQQKYEAFLNALNAVHPGDIEFRVAETPVFVDAAFKQKVIDACETIVDVILQPGFREKTEAAIPAHYRMPGEGERCEFIAFDFGICESEKGGYEPQLIEMQGFPSLFAYQVLHTDITKAHWPLPANYDSYLNGYSKEDYIKLLKEVVLGGYDTKEVILMEIYPEQQKTRIDFLCTEDYIGIKTVCYTRVRSKGQRLFYFDDEGNEQTIKRIYNRVIFDDLEKQDLPQGVIDLKATYDVEWCPHPHWFYRISKFTLPFIESPYVPQTMFLHEADLAGLNLEDYVLKPLFSFAGQGVVIDVTPDDINSIPDPEHWILQRKVKYADAVVTPDIPAKAEIRIFYFWPPGAHRPLAVQNLARLSKGKMIGVRYNADKEWVGGSLVLFEQ